MSFLKKAFAPVALCLALVGCAESPQEAAQRPEVVNQMVQASMETCTNKGPVAPEAYETRLRTVLNDVHYTSSLKTLQDHGVTVCLDQRLSNQNLGFWDRGAKAVLYNNQNQSGIVSVWDNGKMPQEGSFWHLDTYDYGGRDLTRLARSFNKGDVPADAKVMYAGVESCGKNCSDIYWRTPQHFDKDTQAKNPQLAQPPAAIPAAPVKPAPPSS